jgi:hypothetical protein
MELSIKKLELKPIIFNYEDLKKELKERLIEYRGLVYTDDTIKIAKEDRAKLNSLKTTLDNKRKEVKKQILEPYESFEAQLKEIISLIDEPTEEIDKQVKAYEGRKKDEKRKSIEEFFEEQIGDLKEILSFDRIYNQRWLNATYNMADIEQEIIGRIFGVADDLKAIDAIDSEFKLQIKNVYLDTLSLSEALRENSKLEERKSKIEEYDRRKKDDDRKCKSPKNTITLPSNCVSPTTLENKEIYTAPPEPELFQIDFRVWVTEEQKKLLRSFFMSNHIKYGGIN